MPFAATASVASPQYLSFAALSVSSQWEQQILALQEGCVSLSLLPPCKGWAVQAGRWDEGKACPIGFYRKLLFLRTLVIWLICSSSIFGNINPVPWDYECGDAWSSCLHMSYLLQKKNMLLLLLLLILSSIISSLLLCLSLTSSQLHVAPYLLRLLRRPQLSFPAQHQESL